MPDTRVPNSERCLQVLQQTPGILRNLLLLATREQLEWRSARCGWWLVAGGWWISRRAMRRLGRDFGFGGRGRLGGHGVGKFRALCAPWLVVGGWWLVD